MPTPASPTWSTTSVPPLVKYEAMSKALIATDGSEFALTAAKRAKQLLEPTLEVTLLTVVPPPVMPVAAPVTGIEAAPIATPETTEELTEAYLEEAQGSLERTAKALGGSVARRVEYGDPATESLPSQG